MTKGTVSWAMVAVMGGTALLGGRAMAQMAATQPSATTKPAKAGGRHRKLTKPYADMKSLTPQQQDQISKLHEDALDQVNKIHEKERDDIAALLTPQQQAELVDATGKEKEDRKLATPRRKRGEATTMPTR